MIFLPSLSLVAFIVTMTRVHILLVVMLNRAYISKVVLALSLKLLTQSTHLSHSACPHACHLSEFAGSCGSHTHSGGIAHKERLWPIYKWIFGHSESTLPSFVYDALQSLSLVLVLTRILNCSLNPSLCCSAGSPRVLGCQNHIWHMGSGEGIKLMASHVKRKLFLLLKHLKSSLISYIFSLILLIEV